MNGWIVAILLIGFLAGCASNTSGKNTTRTGIATSSGDILLLDKKDRVTAEEAQKRAQLCRLPTQGRKFLVGNQVHKGMVVIIEKMQTLTVTTEETYEDGSAKGGGFAALPGRAFSKSELCGFMTFWEFRSGDRSIERSSGRFWLRPDIDMKTEHPAKLKLVSEQGRWEVRTSAPYAAIPAAKPDDARSVIKQLSNDPRIDKTKTYFQHRKHVYLPLKTK